MRRGDDPFDDIFREIERMMQDMMGGAKTGFEVDAGGEHTHVDVHEYEDRLQVVADLPGVRKEDINLQCDGRTLTISASSETRDYDERIRLPVRVDEQSATATYNNGVLEVTLDHVDDSANISVE